MSTKQQTISGYDELKKTINELGSTTTNINIYLTGSKLNSGQSWCPDCNDAHPHVMKAVSSFIGDAYFFTVIVGDRSFWKDMKNPFRIDKDIHISVIPSLIRWKKPQRLEGEQCCNAELLEMFFTDDD